MEETKISDLDEIKMDDLSQLWHNDKTLIEFSFTQNCSKQFTYVNFSPHNTVHIASKWYNWDSNPSCLMFAVFVLNQQSTLYLKTKHS